MIWALDVNNPLCKLSPAARVQILVEQVISTDSVVKELRIFSHRVYGFDQVALCLHISQHAYVDQVEPLFKLPVLGCVHDHKGAVLWL